MIMSEYQNIKKYFAKGFVPNCSKEVLVIKKAKNTVPWTYVTNDLTGKEIVGMFYEKEFLETKQKEFRVAKVIKKKVDKLYVKWKGYDKFFNRWIEKTLLYKMSYFPELTIVKRK